MSVHFTPAELRALAESIDMLSGGNAGDVFIDTTAEDINDPTISACVKLFTAVGWSHLVPDHLHQEE